MDDKKTTEYENIEREATFDYAYIHKEKGGGTSYNFTTDKGKFYASAGKKLTGEPVKGNKYLVSLGRKVGNKTWYLNAFELIGPAVNTQGVVDSATTKETGQTYADGQARGNYRTNLTNFIIANIQQGKDISAINTSSFNELLRSSEIEYFETVKIEPAPEKKEEAIEPEQHDKVIEKPKQEDEIPF